MLKKEIPINLLWEDDKHLAFLDINPIQDGHTLIIPKYHQDYIFEMEDDKYLDLMNYAKKIAEKIKEKLSCKRVCVLVEGYAVPHVHIHLVPTNTDEDLKKEDRSRKVSQEDFLKIKNKLLS